MAPSARLVTLLLALHTTACTSTPPTSPIWDGCWDEHGDVPVHSPEAGTDIGATPLDVIDVVDGTTLTARLVPDADHADRPSDEVRFTVRIGAFVSAFERELFEDTDETLGCQAGPLLAVDVVAILESEDLGPGEGTLTLWSRGATAEEIWVAGPIDLDAPPAWLTDREPEPGSFRLEFLAHGPTSFAPYDPAAAPGTSWANPSGWIVWRSDQTTKTSSYRFYEAEHATSR